MAANYVTQTVFISLFYAFPKSRPQFNNEDFLKKLYYDFSF